MKAELEEVSYGFILRQDNEVNRVATPTKISSYLSSGVLPIYSECLKGFHGQAQDKSYACCTNIGDDTSALIEFIANKKDKNVIQSEIEELFNTYYSSEKHAENISLILKRLL